MLIFSHVDHDLDISFEKLTAQIGVAFQKHLLHTMTQGQRISCKACIFLNIFGGDLYFDTLITESF